MGVVAFFWLALFKFSVTDTLQTPIAKLQTKMWLLKTEQFLFCYYKKKECSVICDHISPVTMDELCRTVSKRGVAGYRK